MNGLSWFIYFANIVNTVSGWSAFMAIVAGVLFFIFTVITNFMLAYMESSPETYKNDIPAIKALKKNMGSIAIPILLVCTPLALLVPDRQTMILMAGSEMGERILKSEVVKGVVDPGMELVKSWIKAETEKLVNGNKKDK